VEEAAILAQSGARGQGQREAYRRYVEAGLAESAEEFVALLKRAGWGIGEESFQRQVREWHTARMLAVGCREDVSFRRVEPSAGVEEVLEAVAQEFGIEPGLLQRRQYGCVARAIAAQALVGHAGLNQREVGVILQVGSGSAVSRQLRRLPERQVHDEALRQRIGRIARAIAAAQK